MTDSAALADYCPTLMPADPKGAPMPELHSPTLRRIRLAGEMRRLRQTAGLSLAEAAERAGAGHTEFKVGYVERRTAKRINPRDIADLLDVYGVTDAAKRQELLTLAKDASQRSWWYAYRDAITKEYSVFLDFEVDASCIYSHVHVVPGLLQTEGYARALISGGPAELTKHDIDERVKVRVKRQQILTRDNPARLWVVMDESALRRNVGGSDVMREQMSHLVEMAKLPNVTMQVIPFSAGAHVGTAGSFAILEFADPVYPRIVYTESISGETFLEDPEDVAVNDRAFRELIAVAASPADTINMITASAK